MHLARRQFGRQTRFRLSDVVAGRSWLTTYPWQLHGMLGRCGTNKFIVSCLNQKWTSCSLYEQPAVRQTNLITGILKMLLMWVFRIFRAKDEYEINLEVIQKAEFKKKKKKVLCESFITNVEFCSRFRTAFYEFIMWMNFRIRNYHKALSVKLGFKLPSLSVKI